MKVLKAYTDAGALGQQGYTLPRAQRNVQKPVSVTSGRGGDMINISDEAREMLASGGKSNLSVMPQDAVYDQNGHVTRQMENLQAELRHLVAEFTAQPATAGMMPHLRAMQSRLASISTQV